MRPKPAFSKKDGDKTREELVEELEILRSRDSRLKAILRRYEEAAWPMGMRWAEIEANLNKALEIAHVGTWIWDLNDDTLFWTDEVYRIYGVAKGDFKPSHETFLNMVVPDDRERLENAIRASVSERKHYEIDHRIRRPDGEVRYIHTEGETIFNNDTPSRMLGVSYDITERKHAEEALRESEEKFHKMADSANVGILLVQDEDIIYINQALAALGGYTVEECKHLKYWDVMPQDKKEYIRWAGNARQQGWVGPSRSELKIIRKDGGEIWLDCSWAVPALGGRPAVIVICVDITERKKAEELLGRSKNLYKTLAEAAQDLIFIIGRNDKVIYTNNYAANAFGKRPQDIIGMPRKDLFPQKISERQAKRLATVFETGNPALGEDTVLYGNREIWINTRLVPIWGENGRVEAVLGISRDITERKRTEEALRESEERFRVLSETSPTSVFVVQGDKFVYANLRALAQTGYSRDEMLLKHFWDIVHPDYREFVKKNGLARQRGKPASLLYEIKYITKSGEEQWAELVSRNIQYGGKPAVIVTAWDITERKHAEEALRESEKKFRVLAETSPAAIFLYQGEKYVYANPMAETLTGYSLDELLAGDAWEWIHPESKDLVKDRARKRQKGELAPTQYEVKYRARDGREGWVDFSAGLIEYGGKPAGLATAFDVTKRMQAEEELKAAKQQAELYLDLMGHDINNLHQVALGYLELAKGMPPGEGQASFLDKPMEVLLRSTKLIDNVRKLQKLRDGVYQAQEVDVGQVLADIRSEYEAVSGKKITLRMDMYGRCFVYANALLHDVFSNLVNNAVKHTGEQAEITISLDMVEDNGRRYCRVSVEDNGPGIPDGNKEKIFNRMHMGSARGMGLGLYIVRTLVNSYKGRVWVEDRVPGDHSQGARFVVMLPVVKID